MFNQEQLAAIAAAMSVVQRTMQSNPTNSTSPPTSLASLATENSNHHQQHSNNLNFISNNLNLAAVQQQLAAVAVAAMAGSQTANGTQNYNQHNHHQLQQRQVQQNQLFGDANLDFQPNQLAAGLASMASLESALPSMNDHQSSLNHLSNRHIGSPSGSSIDNTQLPPMNQYLSQYDGPNFDLSPSPPKQNAPPTNLRLNDQQQQIIMSQLRFIQQVQQQQQQQQQQHPQDLRLLNDMPPKLMQQQHHQQPTHIDQYQTNVQHQTEKEIMAQISLERSQTVGSTTQRQSLIQQQPNNEPQLQQNHQQHSPASGEQALSAAKSNRPISYSAIVAKSTGALANSNGQSNAISNSTSNNGTTASSTYVNNIIENATNNLTGMASQRVSNVAASNNTFGGLDQSASLNNSSPSFSATSNHTNSVSGDSDSTNRYNSFNGTNGMNGHSVRSASHFNASSSIVRGTLNNHLANQSTHNIFSTNNNLASSLGHTNGSSLLKHHHSNNNTILAHEPTLDNSTIDNPPSPAHPLYKQQNHSFRQNQMPTNLLQQQQPQNHHSNTIDINNILGMHSARDKHSPPHGRATNLLGFMGLYVGNLSPDLTKEQLEKIFSKYGEPVKAHRLIRSPVAFIKYENTESPRAAIDDLYGLLLPDLTLNQDQPLKLHFDRNDAQLKANYRPTDLPKEDNGECYGWRTTVCRRGKSCTKKHIPINRGIDFQMWMIKSTTNPTTVTGTT